MRGLTAEPLRLEVTAARAVEYNRINRERSAADRAVELDKLEGRIVLDDC